MHSFVTARLDYLNSLLYGMPDYVIKRLQRLLNTAARIVTNLGKYDHVTDAMKSCITGLLVKGHLVLVVSYIQYRCIV